MEAIDTVLRFIAGEIEAGTFENALYTDASLEKLLREHPLRQHGTHVAEDLYDRLVSLDYSRLEARVDAIAILEAFLKEKGISYSKNEKNSEIFSLMLNTQPQYLDMDSAFFENHILPADRNMPKAELKKCIRENIKRHFKYQSKTPQWLQNPQWIMKNGRPLFFVGQLPLKNAEIFHDQGAVYIFLDTESGDIETVKQFL